MSNEPPFGYHYRLWDIGEGAKVSVCLPTSMTEKQVERMRKFIHVLGIEMNIPRDPTAHPELEPAP